MLNKPIKPANKASVAGVRCRVHSQVLMKNGAFGPRFHREHGVKVGTPKTTDRVLAVLDWIIPSVANNSIDYIREWKSQIEFYHFLIGLILVFHGPSNKV